MKMKNKSVYEIRCWTNDSAYSKLMSNKLRERSKAIKLVKRLKRMGIDAFSSKLIIKVPK